MALLIIVICRFSERYSLSHLDTHRVVISLVCRKFDASISLPRRTRAVKSVRTNLRPNMQIFLSIQHPGLTQVVPSEGEQTRVCPDFHKRAMSLLARSVGGLFVCSMLVLESGPAILFSALSGYILFNDSARCMNGTAILHRDDTSDISPLRTINSALLEVLRVSTRRLLARIVSLAPRLTQRPRLRSRGERVGTPRLGCT